MGGLMFQSVHAPDHRADPARPQPLAPPYVPDPTTTPDTTRRTSRGPLRDLLWTRFFVNFLHPRARNSRPRLTFPTSPSEHDFFLRAQHLYCRLPTALCPPHPDP